MDQHRGLVRPDYSNLHRAEIRPFEPQSPNTDSYIKLAVFKAFIILLSPPLIHTMNSYSHALCDSNDALTLLSKASQYGKKTEGECN